MEHFLEQFDDDFRQIPEYNVSIDKQNYDIETLKKIFSCIDLTSLNTDDRYSSIELFCAKVRDFRSHFTDIPNVAAVCTYSKYAIVQKRVLGETDVKRAVVTAGFPSSQTIIQNKIDETRNAIFDGATEIDFVICVGEFFDKKYESVCSDIYAMKVHTKAEKRKVILETGMLNTPENIWNASLLAMEAEANFIKTSTGKHSVSATPEAVWIMAHAIKAFDAKKGTKTGIKPSGGIVTVEDAMLYWSIVEKVLGEKYLEKNFFRFGASKLANNILTEIERLRGNTRDVRYF